MSSQSAEPLSDVAMQPATIDTIPVADADIIPFPPIERAREIFADGRGAAVLAMLTWTAQDRLLNGGHYSAQRTERQRQELADFVVAGRTVLGLKD